MAQLRRRYPEEICGKKIERCIDYMESEKTGFPKSNVLEFDFGNSESVVIRPSGTEPKLKIYLSVYHDTERMEKFFNERIGL